MAVCFGLAGIGPVLSAAGKPAGLAGLLRRGPSWLWRWEAQFKGAEFSGPSYFYGRPLISLAPQSQMVFGAGATVVSSPRESLLGIPQRSVLRTWVPGAKLTLGPRVCLIGAVLCAAISIEVGEGTLIESGAMVIDTDFHWPVGELGWADEDGSRARPVRIGRGVLIGPRAVIMKGVTIGDRAFVTAGAIVTRDVPSHHIAMGNPARTLPLADTAGGCL